MLDVGGTLWPNSFGMDDADRTTQAQAVAATIDEPVEAARELIDAVRHGLEEGQAHPLYRPVEQIIAEALAATNRSRTLAREVRKAMCVHVGSRITPHAGAARLLRGLRELQLRTVILSNTTFRGADDYGADFGALGWSDDIDAVVTSLDAGRPKPDEAIFRTALDVSGSAASATAMVGNSEAADIVPAHALGLRSILVAIEDPPPARTQADAVVTSLAQALDVLTSWSR